MSKLIALLVIALFYSCSIEKEALSVSQTFDSDGDMMSDQAELDYGRSPYLADIPDLEVHFLQNYSITVHYLEGDEQKEFKIDTKVARGQADFKYRVGDLLASHLVFKEASKIGKFNTHHFGEFSDTDLSWIKYPHIDERFYLAAMDKFHRDWNIENITVTLENSIKLKGNGLYRSIKNLEVNFRYYGHEEENYVLLGTKRIARHFSSGVTETFEVVLENVPLNLVRDSYFWRGEFIISEIKDFEIPHLKTTYRQLLDKVREKTVPVLYNTPLASKIYYVALGKTGKKTFHEILSTIFDTQFTIAENKLIKVEQFANNLSDYTYLQEIKNKHKEGQWFVFTNPLSQHYLDYSFGDQDKIALSYITGDILAQQSDEIILSHSTESTAEHGTLIPLGNIAAHSEAHIRLTPLSHWGEKVKIWEETVNGGYGGKVSSRCKIKFSSFHPFNEQFTKKDLTDKFSQITLLIGPKEYSLKKIIDKKMAILYQKESAIHIHIKNLAQITDLGIANENSLFLRISPISETVFNGIFLTEWDGQHKRFCIRPAMGAAKHHKLPISIQSLEFNDWKHLIDKKTIIGEDKTYFQHFSLKISAIIINLFN